MIPNAFTLFALDESGATSIEYALIATIVSVGIIVALTAFADALSNLWVMVSSNVTANI